MTQELSRELSNEVNEVQPQIATYPPRADVYETQDGLVVLADMPGVDQTSVDIRVERNILTIKGDRAPLDHGDRRLGYQEYEVGRYERQFTLSDEVDVARIEATVKDGVLSIVLPKAESAKPRKIQVNAG